MTDLTAPKDCKPVDPRKVEAVYRFATNSDREVWDGNNLEQAQLRAIHFKNIPLRRAIYALEDSFPENRDFHCAALRFWALLRLLSRGELSRWVKTDPDRTNLVEVHPAVFYVAAKINLNENADFSLDDFLKELERFEQDHPEYQ